MALTAKDGDPRLRVIGAQHGEESVVLPKPGVRAEEFEVRREKNGKMGSLQYIQRSNQKVGARVLTEEDIDTLDQSQVNYDDPLIQPNDVLRIDVSALNPESAIPYNRQPVNGVQGNSVDMMKIDGYLVSNEYSIEFPILGEINVPHSNRCLKGM